MAVELISKIKPKNNGTFSLVDAEDVQVNESGKRLDQVLNELNDALPEVTTADNDKIIQVVEGKLAAVRIPFAEGESV